MFIDISMLTTVFISTERCLCVILPFKVKGLITASRAAKILIIIYLFQFSCYMPVFVTNGLSWQPTMMYTTNQSTSNLRLDIWFAPGRVQIETVSNIFNSISIPTISFITVVACTYILIQALRRSAHFRSQAASSHTSAGDTSQRNALKERNLENGRETRPAAGLESHESKDKAYILSSKDRKVGKLVTLVAVVFILCSMPQLMVVYGRRFLPDLDVNGRYENFMWTAFGTGFIIGGINACINMFIYLNSSSRYKTVFNEIFCHGDT
ncbi:unnamed protein product [Lymnaea stagnalis]|uniref:G-protein coupled receptors family 1 profile domain-containing protein n=1 Tax=Lymnaea stagnalis TaxID=6523 RepID=A0AAV2H3K1_LYMST